MEPEDWVKFQNATDCHICNKSLIKDEFFDSLPVWSIEGGEGCEKSSYGGQWHKKCFYTAQKEEQWKFLCLKKLTEKKKTSWKQNFRKIVGTVETLYFRKTSETQ